MRRSVVVMTYSSFLFVSLILGKSTGRGIVKMGTATRPNGDGAGDKDDFVLREIEAVATADSAALMYCEAGTGVDRSCLHNPNSRKSSAFVKLNCAAEHNPSQRLAATSFKLLSSQPVRILNWAQ